MRPFFKSKISTVLFLHVTVVFEILRDTFTTKGIPIELDGGDDGVGGGVGGKCTSVKTSNVLEDLRFL